MDVHPSDLNLAEARRLVARAVDKAEQLGVRGGIAVVGASGGLITASRLDRGGPGGMGRARSKAWIAATQQVPTAEHLHRMTTLPGPISTGFLLVSPEAAFPGAGGMPVLDDEGVVVAGIAASGATVSPFLPAGIAPEAVSADGAPANPEDLLVAYALGVPYVGQHGDDLTRWQARFGDLVVDRDRSLGIRPAPPATRQLQLGWARALADRATERAAVRGRRVAVAVVDPGGDPIQLDRMDGAPVAALDVALATAATAARFGRSSGSVAGAFGAAVSGLAALASAPFLAAPGGHPLRDEDRLVGGLGVAGPDPEECDDLAREILT
jgi:uncharacterized protein GlcG (DUF336 family)